jgi:hypothetical protein
MGAKDLLAPAGELNGIGWMGIGVADSTARVVGCGGVVIGSDDAVGGAAAAEGTTTVVAVGADAGVGLEAQ